MMRAVLLLLLTGTQHVEVVVAKPCISKVELGEKTECAGPDLKHMTCHGLLVTYQKGCEVLRVVRDK